MRKKRSRIFTESQNSTTQLEPSGQEFNPTEDTDAEDIDDMTDEDDGSTILDDTDKTNDELPSSSPSTNASTLPKHISTSLASNSSSSLNDQLLSESITTYIQQLLSSQHSKLTAVIDQLQTTLQQHEERLEENHEALLEAVEELSNLTSSVEEDLEKQLKKFVPSTRSIIVNQLSNALHEELKATMENGHKNYQVLIKMMDQNYSALFSNYKKPFKLIQLILMMNVLLLLLGVINLCMIILR